MKKEILLYGLCGGLLIAAMKLAEYRFLVVEHSLEIYGGIVAATFAVVGIRLGQTLTRRDVVVVTERVPSDGPFVRNEPRLAELGITPRELEILEQIASGKSTREIAGALFVSENTVKTHTSRLFDKLNVTRRTQAVQAGRSNGLIP
ncbi:MAG TPA: LuxR C-terminal-related transcriptional regulator [Vicinamibacterales bacterium]|jgi:DNA-binding CsgD family transcriptional regulator|nr:LuxR C-terminal-related transcriptional regulator [Vicinamibacterales bacterium]